MNEPDNVNPSEQTGATELKPDEVLVESSVLVDVPENEPIPEGPTKSGDTLLSDPPSNDASAQRKNDPPPTPVKGETTLDDAGASNDERGIYRNENWSTTLTAGARSHSEKTLENALLAATGSALRDTFVKSYCNTPDLEPGLKIIISTLPFALSWLNGSRHSNNLTPTLYQGLAKTGTQVDDLRKLLKLYSDKRFMIVVIDDNAAINRLFWKKNHNLDQVNKDATECGLSLVLVISPEHMKNLDWDAQIHDGIKKQEIEISPTASNTIVDIVRIHAPEKCGELAATADLQEGTTRFASVLAALIDDRIADLNELLRSDSVGATRNRWKGIFTKSAVNAKTREPAAASALFLGAHFSGIRSRQFIHLHQLLWLRAIAHWPEPREPSDDEEVPNHHWRSSVDDESRAEVDLIMRQDSEGVRRVRFVSAEAAGIYAEWFAENTPGLENELFRALVGLGRPLDEGDELLAPFSMLCARRVLGEHGGGQHDATAVELYGIIAHHRQDADEAHTELEQQLTRAVSAPEDVLNALEAWRRAQEKEQEAEFLSYSAPQFVAMTLRTLYQQDLELGIRAIRSLWHHASKQAHGEGGAVLAFWRRTIIGAVLALQPDSACDKLAELFDEDPLALNDIGQGTSTGLAGNPEALIAAVCGACSAVDKASGRSKAWRFAALINLLTIWMHSAANATTLQDRRALSGEAFIKSVTKTLLTGTSMDALANLEGVCCDLLEPVDMPVKDLHFRAGLISRQWITAMLRNLFLFRGKEYDRFAQEIDVAGSAIKFRDPKRWCPNDQPGSHIRFDAWKRKTLQSISAAIVTAELRLSNAEPDWRIKLITNASEGPQLTTQILREGLQQLKEDLGTAWTAIGEDDTRFEAYKVQFDVLAKLFRATDPQQGETT